MSEKPKEDPTNKLLDLLRKQDSKESDKGKEPAKEPQPTPESESSQESTEISEQPISHEGEVTPPAEKISSEATVSEESSDASSEVSVEKFISPPEMLDAEKTDTGETVSEEPTASSSEISAEELISPPEISDADKTGTGETVSEESTASSSEISAGEFISPPEETNVEGAQPPSQEDSLEDFVIQSEEAAIKEEDTLKSLVGLEEIEDEEGASDEESLFVDEPETQESVFTLSSEEKQILTLFRRDLEFELPSKKEMIINYILRWLKGEQEVIGLDVGNHSVKMIKLKHTLSGLQLSHYAMYEFVHSDGRKKNVPQEEIVDSLSKLLDSRKLKKGKVVVSIAGPQTAIRKFVVPAMPEKEVDKAVNWQVQKNIPFPIANSEYDYKINLETAEADEMLPVSIFAAEKSFLRSTLANFKKAGINVRKIISPVHALFNVVARVSKDETENASVVIEIDSDRMSICFIDQKMIQFIRDIPFGVNELSEGLQGTITLKNRTVNLDKSMAKQILDHYGIPMDLVAWYSDKDVSLNPISRQVSGSVDRLVDEIIRSLDYYKKKFPELEEPETIYIAGVGGNILHMGLLLKNAIGKQVIRLNPLFGIQIPEDVLPRRIYTRLASSFVVAGGMALDPVDDGVNLAPMEAKEEAKFSAVKRVFAIAAGLIGLFLGITSISSNFELSNMREEAAEARSQLANLSQVQRQYLSAKMEKSALETFSTIMNDEDNKVAWIRAQLKMLSTTTPQEMILRRLDVQTNVTAADRDKGVPHVQIGGAVFADDSFSDLILNDFQKALVRSELYSQVEIIEQNSEGSGRGRAMFFLMNCVL